MVVDQETKLRRLVALMRELSICELSADGVHLVLNPPPAKAHDSPPALSFAPPQAPPVEAEDPELVYASAAPLRPKKGGK